MVRARLSAVIIAKDEERNIARALASVAWAGEVVAVVDAESSDRTEALALGAGARVEVRPWRGYVATKNEAAALAAGDWILSIDADEEVTPELRGEIEAIVSSDEGAADGYRFPRRNHYWGRWIRHCGWYPDLQLRLWRRGRGRWVGGRVHERVEVQGRIGRTRAALNHFTYDSIGRHLRTMERYSDLSARDRFEAGRRTNALLLALTPPWQFFRSYILRGGILDGTPGLVVSALAAYYAFLKHARLWELQSGARTPSE